MSDHLPIFASINLSNSKSNPFKNTFRRSFSDSKREPFIQCLKEHLKKLDLSLDPNTLLDEFLRCMKTTIDEICPLKKVSRKQAQQLLRPWMTKEILKEIKIRDDMKMLFVKNQNSEGSNDHKNWKKQRNKVNRMVLAAKNKDIENSCEKAKGNNSKMWKVINKATNRKQKSNITPDHIKIRTANGATKKTKCKKEIANEMNRQFAEMGSKLAEKLQPTDVQFSHYLKSTSHCSLFSEKASETEVGNHIDEGKSVGIDDIPPKVLKWVKKIILPILTLNFNKCIELGIYPDSLKIAEFLRVDVITKMKLHLIDLFQF